MRLIYSIFALLFSVSLLIMGNGFLNTLLATRLSLEGIEPFHMGLILVNYSVGFVIGTLYCDRVVKRVGHIRTFAVFCALMAMTALCYPMKMDSLIWGALRVAGGLSMAGLLIVVESWLSSMASNSNRATLFGVYQMCIYLSVSVGQILVSTGDPKQYFLYSLAALLCIAALIPLSLTRMKPPSIEQVERLSVKQIFAASPLGVVSSMASGMIISAFYSMGPLYATLNGFTIDQLAHFMALSILAAVIFAWPIGWICDRFDRARLLLYVVSVTGLVSLALTLIPGAGFWPMTILCALFMGVVAAVYPIGVAITTDRLSSHQMVSASATLLLSYGIGSCIGPLLSAGLIDWTGAKGMFLANLMILIVLFVYTWYRLGRGKVVPVDQQEHYVPVNPSATPVITELDPRNPDFNEAPQEDMEKPVNSESAK